MSYGEVEENVMTRWLYRYEAKKIQDYVLGTSRLKEIAAASAQVEQLGDEFKGAHTKAGVTDAKVITCAAGQATVIFANEASLRRLASVWPMYCARTRPGLPVIQGWVAFPEGEPDAKGYAELMRALFAKLDADRMRPRASLPEVGPLVARAGRSGLAAVEYATKDRALCDEAMRAKLREARETHEDFRERLLEETPFAGRRFAHGGEEDRSFDEGYVAIVHADGNNIGKRFQETPFKNQEKLSKGLGEATREAVKRALRHVSAQPRRHAAWNAAGALLPFRPVVLGGDDVTVMLRADDALPFTYEFLRAFQEETASGLKGLLTGAFKDGLTASAGVAMVKSAFPYHAAYDLAEELCQHAKSEAKRHACTPEGHPTGGSTTRGARSCRPGGTPPSTRGADDPTSNARCSPPGA